MITIAVPPALPACLTVATAIAISRLQQHDIFVSNPSAVTLAGHLDVLCFDKTGTLTEPGLDLQGVVPAAPDASGFAPICSGGEVPGALQELLATCHGLAQLGQELVGDPLDQRLFQSTGGWVGVGGGAGAGHSSSSQGMGMTLHTAAQACPSLACFPSPRRLAHA